MGSHLGGIRSGWNQESQAGACIVFPPFMNTLRNHVIYNMENSAEETREPVRGYIFTR